MRQEQYSSLIILFLLPAFILFFFLTEFTQFTATAAPSAGPTGLDTPAWLLLGVGVVGLFWLVKTYASSWWRRNRWRVNIDWLSRLFSGVMASSMLGETALLALAPLYLLLPSGTSPNLVRALAAPQDTITGMANGADQGELAIYLPIIVNEYAGEMPPLPSPSPEPPMPPIEPEPILDLAVVNVNAIADALLASDGPSPAFRITLNEATSSPITISYAISGTAVSGVDFEPLSGTAIVPAHSTEVDIILTPILDDVQVDSHKTVSIKLVESEEYILGLATTAIVTIEPVPFSPDPITPEPISELPVVNVETIIDSILEGGGPSSVFRITLSEAISSPITVSYTISGTAVSGVDFEPLSGTAIVTANSTEGDITLTPIDNAVMDGNKTVSITLAESDAYMLGSSIMATVTIVDDDQVVIVRPLLSQIDDQSGTVAAFEFVRLSPTGDPVEPDDQNGLLHNDFGELTVAFELGGTAVSGEHYEPLPDTITFAPDQSIVYLSVTPIPRNTFVGDKNITVEIIDDGIYLIAEPSFAQLTIRERLQQVSIEVANHAVLQTSRPGAFHITREGNVAEPLSVAYAIAGTAINGTDYYTISHSLVLEANVLSATLPIVPLVSTLEGGERSVRLTLNNSPDYLLLQNQARLMILENEPVAATITADDDVFVRNGSQATFTVSRDGDLSQSLPVTFAVGGTAVADEDYVSRPNVVTIPAGSSSTSLAFILPTAAAVRPERELTVDIIPGAAYDAAEPRLAVATLVEPQPLITVTADVLSLLRDEGETGTFTISRLGNSAIDLPVNLAWSGTAVNGLDYQAMPNTVLMPAGETEVSLEVASIPAATPANDLTISLQLQPDSAYILGDEQTASMVLLDNGQRVGLSVANHRLTEMGDEVSTVTVARNQATAEPLTVTLSFTGTAVAGIDYETITNNYVVIPAHSEIVTFTVAPLIGSPNEGVSQIRLDIVDSNLYSIAPQQQTRYMYIEHEANIFIRALQPRTTPGSQPGLVVVSRTVQLSEPLTVSLGITGTAVAGVDYEPLPQTVVIPAGETAVSLPISAIDHEALALPKTIAVTLQADPAYKRGRTAAERTASVTIIDGLNVYATTDMVVEGENTPLVFTIERQGATADDLLVYYVLSGEAKAGIDYMPVSGHITGSLYSLVLPAGQAETTIEIWPIAQDEPQPTRSVRIELLDEPEYDLGADYWALGHIHSNTNIVAIAAVDSEASSSGDTATFVLTRTGSLAEALTVEIVPTGRAQNGVHYQLIDTEYTFAPGQSTIEILIDPISTPAEPWDKTIELILISGSDYLRHPDATYWLARAMIRQQGDNVPPMAFDVDIRMVAGYTATADLVALGGFDLNGDNLTAVLTTNPQQGTAVLEGSRLLYTAHPTYVGVDEFQFQLSDGRGGTDTATVRVTTYEPPTNYIAAPRGGHAWLETYEGESITLDLRELVNYPDPSQLIFGLEESRWFEFGVSLDGHLLTYEPVGTLSDTLRITVQDSRPRVTEPDQITIDVVVREAVPGFMNRTPLANSRSIYIEAGDTSPISLDLTQWGIDPDGLDLTYTFFISDGLSITGNGSVTAAQLYGLGSLTIAGDEAIFTPAADLEPGQLINLAYTAVDIYGLEDSGYFQFRVVPAPTFGAIASSDKPVYLTFDTTSLLLPDVGDMYILNVLAYNNLGQLVDIPDAANTLSVAPVSANGALSWEWVGETAVAVTAMSEVGYLQLRAYWGPQASESAVALAAQLQPDVVMLPVGSVTAPVVDVIPDELDFQGDYGRLQAFADLFEQTNGGYYPDLLFQTSIDTNLVSQGLTPGTLFVAQGDEDIAGRIIENNAGQITFEPVDPREIFIAYEIEALISAVEIQERGPTLADLLQQNNQPVSGGQLTNDDDGFWDVDLEQLFDILGNFSLDFSDGISVRYTFLDFEEEYSQEFSPREALNGVITYGLSGAMSLVIKGEGYIFYRLRLEDWDLKYSSTFSLKFYITATANITALVHIESDNLIKDVLEIDPTVKLFDIQKPIPKVFVLSKAASGSVSFVAAINLLYKLSIDYQQIVILGYDFSIVDNVVQPVTWNPCIKCEIQPDQFDIAAALDIHILLSADWKFFGGIVVTAAGQIDDLIGEGLNIVNRALTVIGEVFGRDDMPEVQAPFKFSDLRLGVEAMLSVPKFEFRHSSTDEYDRFEVPDLPPPVLLTGLVGNGHYTIGGSYQIDLVDGFNLLNNLPATHIIRLIPYIGEIIAPRAGTIIEGEILLEYPRAQGNELPVERIARDVSNSIDLQQVCTAEYLFVTEQIRNGRWREWLINRPWDQDEDNPNFFKSPVPLYEDDVMTVHCGIEIVGTCNETGDEFVKFYRKVDYKDPYIAHRYYSFANRGPLHYFDDNPFLQHAVQEWWNPIEDVNVFLVTHYEPIEGTNECRAVPLFEQVGQTEIHERDQQSMSTNYQRRQTPYPMWNWQWNTLGVDEGIYQLHSFTQPRWTLLPFSWHMEDEMQPSRWRAFFSNFPIWMELISVFHDFPELENIEKDEFFLNVGDVTCENFEGEISNQIQDGWHPVDEGGICLRKRYRTSVTVEQCSIIFWKREVTEYVDINGQQVRPPVESEPWIERVIPLCFGMFSGDPHIATMDGMRHTSFSLGEFIYLQPVPEYTGSDGIVIQARQSRVEGWTRSGALSTAFLEVPEWASWITALAVQTDDHIFEFNIPGIDSASEHGTVLNPMQILIDGELQDLSNGLHTFGEAELIVISSQQIRFTYKGYIIQMQVVLDAWLEASIFAPRDDTHHGMMGRPNGNIEDDFLRRDGVPAIDSYDLANSWRITQTVDSLFTYAEGAGPNTFNMPQAGEPPSQEELAPYMDEAEALLTSTCQVDTIDEIRTREVAIELYTGRTAADLIENGVCYYTVYGQITNELVEGLPVPEALVTATLNSEATCTTYSDQQGFYSCNIPSTGEPGTISIEVSKRGSTQVNVTATELPPAAGFYYVEQDLAVSPTTLQLTGTILDGQTGNGLFDAELRVDGPEDAGFAKTFGRTNATGVYTTYLMIDDGITAGTNRYFLTYVPPWETPLESDNRVRRTVFRDFNSLTENELNLIHEDFEMTGVVLQLSGRASFLLDESIPAEGMRVMIEPLTDHPQFTTPCDMTTLIWVGPDFEDFDPRKHTRSTELAGTYRCYVPIEEIAPFDVQVSLIGDDLFTVVVSRTVTVSPTGVATGEIFPVVVPPLEIDTPLIYLEGTVRDPEGEPLAGATVRASSSNGMGGGPQAVSDVNGRYTMYLPLRQGESGQGVNGSVSYNVSYFNVSSGASVDYFGVTTGVPYSITQDFVMRGSAMTFYGRVIDTRTDSPVYDAEILITSPAYSGDDQYLCGVSQLFGPNTVGTGRNWYRPDAYVMPLFPGMIDPPQECRTVIDRHGPDEELEVVYQLTALGESHTITETIPLADLGQWRAVPRDFFVTSITPTIVSLTGTVTRPSGLPLAGAMVYADVLDEAGSSVLSLTPWDLLFGDGDARVRSRTDQAGNYSMDVTLPHGVLTGTIEYDVVFRTLSVTDTQPFTATPYVTTIITRDMVYGHRTVYIEGVITNTYGVDMPYTSVYISSDDIATNVGNVCQTQTDLHGNFVCVAQTKSNEPISITVQAEGMWGSYTETVTAHIEDTAETVEHTLPPVVVDLTVLNLQGLVTSSQGAPLPDVEITVSSSDLYRVAYGQTNENGAYELFAVVKPISGTQTVAGSIDYFVGFGEAGSTYSQIFVVEPGSVVSYTRDFTLDMRVVTFKGEVLNETLLLAAYSEAMTNQGWLTLTDDTMQVNLASFTPDRRATITETLTTAGYELVVDGLVVETAVSALPTFIQLVYQQRWLGLNLPDQGMAVNNTQLRVTSPMYGQLCEYALEASYSSNDYECSARIFSGQPFSITYRLSGEWGSATIPGRVTTIPNIGERVTLERDLFVRPSTLHLSGYAYDRDGQPLSGANITIESQQFVGVLDNVLRREVQVSTNQDGFYETYAIIRNQVLAADLVYEANVRVGSTNFNLTDQQVVSVAPRTLTAATMDFTYPHRRVTLSGRFMNATIPDLPVQGNLTVYSPTLGETICSRSITSRTDDQPAYNCQFLVTSDDNYELVYYVSGDWGSFQTSQSVFGMATDVWQDLEATTRQIVLTGQVVRPGGVPLAEANVSISSHTIINGRRVQLSATTDAEGNYSMRHLLAPGVGLTTIHYTVESEGNVVEYSESFEFSPTATTITVSHDLEVNTSQLTFTGELINSLMGSPGPWSKTRHSIFGDSEVSTTYIIVESPTEGFLCQANGVIREYECTATIATTSPFDVEYRIYGDWGSATHSSRVTSLPPLGSSGTFTQPMVVTPTMLHIQGTVMLTYTESYTGDGALVTPSPIVDAPVHTNLVGELSDPLVSAQWNYPDTDENGRFDLYVVVRQVDGVLTGTLPLIFNRQYKLPAVHFSVEEGIINSMNLTHTFAIDPPAPPPDPNDPTARTLSFRIVHHNALAPGVAAAQPAQQIRVSSPVYGEICNTGAGTIFNPDPDPVKEVTCSLVVHTDEPVDILVQSFGDYSYEERVILVASEDIPDVGQSQQWTEEIQLEPTTIRLAGMITDDAQSPMADVDIAMTLIHGYEQFINDGEILANPSARSQTNGLYETYVLLPGWLVDELELDSDTTEIDIRYELTFDDIPLEYVASNRAITFGALNDYWGAWPFIYRRVLFTGRVLDGNYLEFGNVGVPGVVSVTSPDSFSEFYCDAPVDEESGEFNCEALLESSESFEARLRVNAEWGTATTLITVDNINNVGQTTVVEENIIAYPTSLLIHGNVTDPYGAPLEDVNIVIRNDNIISFRSDIELTNGDINLPPTVNEFMARALEVRTNENGEYTAYLLLRQSIVSGDLDFELSYAGIGAEGQEQFSGLLLNERNTWPQPFNFILSERTVIFEGRIRNVYAAGMGLPGDLTIMVGDEVLCETALNDSDDWIYTGEYRCTAVTHTDAFSATYHIDSPYANITIPPFTIPQDVAGGVYLYMGNYGIPVTTLDLYGIAADSLGNPVPGAQVTILGQVHGVNDRIVNNEGEYQIKVAVPMTLTAQPLAAQVTLDDWHTTNPMQIEVPIEADLISGTENSVELPLIFDKRRVRLTGYVQHAVDANADMGGLNVRLATEQGQWCNTTTWSDGRYQCPYLITSPGETLPITATINGPWGSRILTTTLPVTDLPLAGHTGNVAQDWAIEPTTLILTGQVSDSDGVPLNGVTIYITGDAQSTVTTDSNGRYNTYLFFDDAQDTASLDLGVRYRDLTVPRHITTSLAAGQVLTVTNPLTVTERQVTLTGVVTNTVSGQPVAGMDVAIASSIYPDGVCTTQANQHGVYTCPPVIVASGFAFTATVSGSWGSNQIEHTVVLSDLPAIGRAGSVVVDLPIGPTTLYLDGRLTDRVGTPLPGATIQISGDMARTISTDENGRFASYFSYPDGQPTTTLSLAITYGQLTMNDSLAIDLSSGGLISQTTPYTFTQRQITFYGAAYHQLVTDLPLAGANLTLTTPEGATCTRTTSATGGYICTRIVTDDISGGLPISGTVASSWGSTSQNYLIPAAALPALGQSGSVLFNLYGQPTTLALTGHISRGDGLPVAGADITVSGGATASLSSAEDGSFLHYIFFTAAVTTTVLTVTASYGDFVMTDTMTTTLVAQQVVTATTELQFEQRRIRLQGQVVNEYDATTPLANTQIQLYQADVGQWCQVTAAADGSYACPEIVLAGTLDEGLVITATLSGPWGGQSYALTIPGDDLPDLGMAGDVTLQLALPATTLYLQGAVTSAEAEPLAGVVIEITGNSSATAVTNEMGQYEVYLAFPASADTALLEMLVTYDALTISDSLTATLQTAAVVSQPYNLTFAQREATFTGQVDNTFVPDMGLSAVDISLSHPEWGTFCETTTDSGGYYSCAPLLLEGVLPVDLTITTLLTATWGQEAITHTLTTADLPPVGSRQPVVVDVAASPTTVVLTGTITTPDGEPLLASVMLSGDYAGMVNSSNDGLYAATFILPATVTETAVIQFTTNYNSYSLVQTAAISLTARQLNNHQEAIIFGVRQLAWTGTAVNTLAPDLPLRQTNVTITHEEWGTLCTSVTANDGSYTCQSGPRNIISNTLALTATLSGNWGSQALPFVLNQADLPAVGTQGTQQLDLTGSPTTIRFTGVVSDLLGTVAGAVIEISGDDLPQTYVTSSQADGTYEVIGYLDTTAISGTLTVDVTQTGYFRERINLPYTVTANVLNDLTVPPVTLRSSNALPICNEYVDDFSMQLTPGWQWIREDVDYWSLTERPDFLRITTQHGEIWGNNATTQNILVREISGQDFEILTSLEFNPTANSQNAGLIIYQDDSNFVYLGSRFSNGRHLILARNSNGSMSSQQFVNDDNLLYLRLVKRDNIYTAYTSLDGAEWTELGSISNNLSQPRVGLFAQRGHTSSADTHADFDWFCAVTTPTVIQTNPGDDTVVENGTISQIQATFSEAIDATTLTTDTVRLYHQESEQAITGTVSYNNSLNRVTLTASTPLTDGNYLATLTPAITDLAGNTLPYTYTWSFVVNTPIYWISDESGLWHDPANWSLNRVPNTNDIVIIDRPGDVTVTVNSGSQAAYSLLSREQLVLSAGTLSIRGQANLYDTFTFISGNLSGPGTVTVYDEMIWTGGFITNWSDVIVAEAAALIMEGSNTKHIISNSSLTNQGTAVWRDTGQIYMYYTGSLINDGTLLLESDALFNNWGSGQSFINNGLVHKTGGEGTKEIQVPFYNEGERVNKVGAGAAGRLPEPIFLRPGSLLFG